MRDGKISFEPPTPHRQLRCHLLRAASQRANPSCWLPFGSLGQVRMVNGERKEGDVWIGIFKACSGNHAHPPPPCRNIFLPGPGERASCGVGSCRSSQLSLLCFSKRYLSVNKRHRSFVLHAPLLDYCRMPRRTLHQRRPAVAEPVEMARQRPLRQGWPTFFFSLARSFHVACLLDLTLRSPPALLRDFEMRSPSCEQGRASCALGNAARAPR